LALRAVWLCPYMKFKATISHEGLRILTQSAAALHYTVVALHCTGRRVTHSVSVAELLPALEKHGKTCHVLLGPEEVCLLQTTGDADGMQIFISLGLVRCLQALELGSLCTQLTSNMCAPQEILFEPQAFKCESRHKNLIGFKCEVALFRRVLQAAGAHDAECVEVLCHSGSVWLQHMVVLLFRHLSPVPVQVCTNYTIKFLRHSSSALVVVDEAILCCASFRRRRSRNAMLFQFQADMKYSASRGRSSWPCAPCPAPATAARAARSLS